MTIQELTKTLKKLVEVDGLSEDTEVYFRHNITSLLDRRHSPVDYILTEQKEGSIVLCYDDGHF